MQTWYRVTAWDKKEADLTIRNDVVRSSDKCIWFAPRREGDKSQRTRISSRYEKWFHSKDDAIAEIDRKNKVRNAKEMKEKIRDAAPQLLEALQSVREFVDIYTDDNAFDDTAWAKRLLIKIDAAIKAATE